MPIWPSGSTTQMKKLKLKQRQRVLRLSAAAAAALEGFVTEPDQRNLEYITPPDASYARQLQLLIEPRQRLRRWLASRQLTIPHSAAVESLNVAVAAAMVTGEALRQVGGFAG